MPIPPNVNTIIVTGTYVDTVGNPLSGHITFETNVPVLDNSGAVVIAGSQVSANLDSTGKFNISLICTDNANLNPPNFFYYFREDISGAQRSFPLVLPHTLGSVVDISSLSPASATTSSSTTYIVSTPQSQQNLFTQSSEALAPFYAALANRKSAPCKILCIGDSITEGQGATGITGAYQGALGFNNTWVSRLRSLLRNYYHTDGQREGGRGYLAAVSTGTLSFGWPSVVVGSPPGVGYGLKAGGVQFNTTGQTISYILTGDACDIMWCGVPFGGTFSYSLDGATAVNISTNDSSGIRDGHMTRVTATTPGTHTLQLAWVSGQANFDGVIEYYGDASQGIQVHDGGHYGWNTGSWVNAMNGGAITSMTRSIGQLAPNLIIITLGVNDQAASITPTTFQANLQTMITDIRAQMTAPYPAIVLNMLPPRINQGTYTYAWNQYVQAAWNVAAADVGGPYGNSIVSVMDFTMNTRMPGADVDVYGLWHAGDLVHPSNIGHQMIADALLNFLTEK